MATYLEVVNDADTVLIGDDYIHLGVRHAVAAVIPDGGQAASGTFSGGSDYACAAFASEDFMCGSAGSTSWTLQRPHAATGQDSANVYVFDKPLQTTAAGSAVFQAWDANGQLVFDSNNDMARAVAVITTYGTFNYTAGRTYALMFLKNSYDRQVTTTPAGNNLYYYQRQGFRTYAKVVGNVVTVSKLAATPVFGDLDEPVGVTTAMQGFNDDDFSILVLDITGFGATGGTVTGHSVSASNISDSVSSGSHMRQSTVTVTGGSGSYTYQWEWVGTHTGLTITAGPTTATVNVTSTGSGVTRTGTLRCTVTDTGNGNVQVYDDASVSMVHAAAIQHTVNVGNLSFTNQLAGYVDKTATATPASGVGPYTYAWTWQGTHTGLEFEGVTNAANVTVRSTGNGQTRTGTIRCTVTDTGNGNVTAYDDATVSIGHEAIALSNRTISETPSSKVGIRLGSSGTVQKIVDSNYTTLSSTEWRDPANFANDYRSRILNNSGAAVHSESQFGGSVGSTTYVQLGSGAGSGWRDFWLDGSGESTSFTLEISRKDGTGVVATATISLEWDVAVVTHTVQATNILSPSNANGQVNKTSTATVSDGVGPFTYAWSWPGGSAPAGLQFISGVTTDTATIRSTGTNQVNTGTARCTVTDTGNGNVTAYDDITISITHGTPP